MLGLSLSRTYALIAQGEVPSVRVGNAIRTPRLAFERWLAVKAEAALTVADAVL